MIYKYTAIIEWKNDSYKDVSYVLVEVEEEFS